MNEAMTGQENILLKKTERALSRIDRLPSLSNVIGEFLEMSKKEMITGRDLQRVISKDQALVSRLLKLANSSFYGRSKSINTITDAIVMIGIDNVKKIVYAVSSEGLTAKEFKHYQYPARGFWLHSMGVAVMCRLLNEKVNPPGFGDEQAFIAGLVHDTGKLIIDEFLADRGGQWNVTMEEEIAIAGIDHALLGQKIMEKWSIPDAIAEAVRWHHDPLNGGRVHINALIVSVADGICNFWNVGTQSFMDLGEDVPMEMFAAGLAQLKISEERFTEMLWEARQKLAGLENLYGREY